MYFGTVATLINVLKEQHSDKIHKNISHNSNVFHFLNNKKNVAMNDALTFRGFANYHCQAI